MHQKKARGKQSQICIHKSWTILFLWRIIYAITVVFLSFHLKLHLVQLWHDLITSVNKGRDLFHLSVHNSASSAFCLWATSKHPPSSTIQLIWSWCSRAEEHHQCSDLMAGAWLLVRKLLQPVLSSVELSKYPASNWCPMWQNTKLAT